MARSRSRKRSRRRTRSRGRSCGKGQIRRKSYRTKSGRRVKSSCIKDRGKPGKGPYTLPPMKKSGYFSDMGYHLDLQQAERRRILKKIVNKHGEVETIRKLNLLRNYNTKGTANYKKLSSDGSYLKTL